MKINKVKLNIQTYQTPSPAYIVFILMFTSVFPQLQTL